MAEMPNNPNRRPLRETDRTVAHHEQDIRGWRVQDEADAQVGTVSELLLNTDTNLVDMIRLDTGAEYLLEDVQIGDQVVVLLSAQAGAGVPDEEVGAVGPGVAIPEEGFTEGRSDLADSDEARLRRVAVGEPTPDTQISEDKVEAPVVEEEVSAPAFEEQVGEDEAKAPVAEEQVSVGQRPGTEGQAASEEGQERPWIAKARSSAEVLPISGAALGAIGATIVVLLLLRLLRRRGGSAPSKNSGDTTLFGKYKLRWQV